MHYQKLAKISLQIAKIDSTANFLPLGHTKMGFEWLIKLNLIWQYVVYHQLKLFWCPKGVGD